ncbi:MAG: citramalate synthase [Deltaproteobacteria bacterium]|nr:citramalate synthase [Deltaproteobacteria bacterium]
MKKPDILIYDTTLRDGTQGEQINFSAEEKIRIAKKLDDLSFHYIEGGWPGSNPKDMRFFELAKKVKFRHARLAAFGSTRKAHTKPEDCPNIAALLQAETPACAVVGKSWDLHVTDILGVSLNENLAMIRDTVSYLKNHDKEVIFDAEHLFDGFVHNPAYACDVIRTAFAAGADMICLCDTNGGSLPHEVEAVIEKIKAFIPSQKLCIHTHNDSGLAVANSIAAVKAGVKMVQGTINGYGERCGNADLITIIGNLHLKMNQRCLPDASIRQMTNLSYFLSDIANVPPLNSRPFVGRSAFAHKGGLHVNAISKKAVAYEHVNPDLMGNERRVLVSDLAGKSNIEYKAKELGIDLGGNDANSKKIVKEIKKMENEGYQFDAADGSLSLLIKKITGEFKEPFTLESYHVINTKTGDDAPVSKAMIKILVGKDEEITADEGNGPVNALDFALRKALTKFYPQLHSMHLVDFKVRVVEGSDGTAAKVRVLLDSRDDDEIWSTIGVSTNVIEASWHALVDSFQYKLSKENLNKNKK